MTQSLKLAPISPTFLSDTRTTVQHFHLPPQPPRPVYVRPPPPPAKAREFFVALAIFSFGVVLVAILTGFSLIWFGIVAALVSGAGLILGGILFVQWAARLIGWELWR
jgi:hypothetical protein